MLELMENRFADKNEWNWKTLGSKQARHWRHGLTELYGSKPHWYKNTLNTNRAIIKICGLENNNLKQVQIDGDDDIANNLLCVYRWLNL